MIIYDYINNTNSKLAFPSADELGLGDVFPSSINRGPYVFYHATSFGYLSDIRCNGLGNCGSYIISLGDVERVVLISKGVSVDFNINSFSCFSRLSFSPLSALALTYCENSNGIGQRTQKIFECCDILMKNHLNSLAANDRVFIEGLLVRINAIRSQKPMILAVNLESHINSNLSSFHKNSVPKAIYFSGSIPFSSIVASAVFDEVIDYSQIPVEKLKIKAGKMFYLNENVVIDSIK
ncbi:hypothetical protein [Serratia fonticola]